MTCSTRSDDIQKATIAIVNKRRGGNCNLNERDGRIVWFSKIQDNEGPLLEN